MTGIIPDCRSAFILLRTWLQDIVTSCRRSSSLSISETSLGSSSALRFADVAIYMWLIKTNSAEE